MKKGFEDLRFFVFFIWFELVFLNQRSVFGNGNWRWRRPPSSHKTLICRGIKVRLIVFIQSFVNILPKDKWLIFLYLLFWATCILMLVWLRFLMPRILLFRGVFFLGQYVFLHLVLGLGLGSRRSSKINSEINNNPQKIRNFQISA
jgi:hypothetical protein